MIIAETSGWETQTPWGVAIGLAALLIGGGALVAWIGVRARRGSLPRNALVGIRVPETLDDDDAWRVAHESGSGLLIASGLLPCVLGIALLARPSENVSVVLTSTGIIGMCVLVLLAGRRGVQAVRAQPNPGDAH